jgi:cell cycle checkpoint protein
MFKLFFAKIISFCGSFDFHCPHLRIPAHNPPAIMASIEPILVAVSSNANHLYTLLRCVGFASKASVQITAEGIRFSVEEGRVLQGLAFLDKGLFTSYSFNPPTKDSSAGDGPNGSDDGREAVLYPHFLISLSALLETLQIFGISDASASNNSMATNALQQNQSTSDAFTSAVLLLDRSCTLRYSQIGSPLSITISERGVTTTCELTAYEPDDPSFGSSNGQLDIPFQRETIIMKIIMRSAWLHNAITELDSTNPTILTISASAKREPFLALSGSGGPFSESIVHFSTDKEGENITRNAAHKVLSEDDTSRSPSKKAKLAPTVTETFFVNQPLSVGSQVKQNYRFALIRKATRAMAVASKVSIRGDIQGVLSLQFMIELGSSGTTGVNPRSAQLAGNVSFVDFRFVPLVDENVELEDEDGG